MATDIVEELQRWLAELIAANNFPQKGDELPGVEIALLSRAIDEIKRLRSDAGTTNEAIPVDKLTSQNDE